MKLNTTSGVISFARKLEEDGAGFYEGLAKWNADDGEVLLSFAKENRRNVVQTERVYYGVISDAIEGCFAFDMDSDEYMLRTESPAEASYPDSLNRAINMEDRTTRFYLDAAEQSKSLLADVPRAFAVVAKKRDNRRLKLLALLEKARQK